MQALDLLEVGWVPLAYNPFADFRNLIDVGDFSINPLRRNIPGLASAGVISSPIAATPTYFADCFFAAGGASSAILMAAVADTSIVGFNQSLKISDFRRRHAYAKRYLDQRRLIRNRWTGHDAARRRRIGVNFRQRGSLKALGATQDDSSESPAGLRKAFVDLLEEGHQRRHFRAR